MPEDKQEEKTVDIDTSGPGADIELPEEKVTEVTETAEPEQKVEEKVEEKQETSDEKQETEAKVEEKKEELEEYSQGVQKRIVCREYVFRKN